MGVKVVATTCLHWSQPSVPHSPSYSQALASAISSPSSKRRSFSTTGTGGDAGALVCRYLHRLDYRSALFGTPYAKLSRTGSWQELSPRAPHRVNVIRRASSSSLESFSDEEFSKQIEELASNFELSDSTEEQRSNKIKYNEERRDRIEAKYSENRRLFEPMESPPDWEKEIIPANIERKANSLELPFSLRMIRRKKQVENRFRETGECAYCSVKKAFSSMVFIIREIQSYTLQMRELLFYEDLQGILERVQKEMHMSFVWLFQQVFSHTPTLMVYVMILLANYSVYSMANNTSIMATQPYVVTTESVSVIDGDDDYSHGKQRFDSSSAIKTVSSGKTTSIGGNNGSGGKYKSIASGTEGDGSFDGVSSSDRHGTVVPDGGVSSIGNPLITSDDGESVSEKKVVTQEEEEVERRLWDSIVDEALRMGSVDRDESLDHETMSTFVASFYVEIESDDHSKYFPTQMMYELALTEEPGNVLLLTNYAQFLYLVVRDYDRAEEFFKRAVKIVPKDAEAFNKYANFLWQARNNLWDAEQAFNEAISAADDPYNSYYAANYAHFLWNTGGDDTCFYPPMPPIP